MEILIAVIALAALIVAQARHETKVYEFRKRQGCTYLEAIHGLWTFSARDPRY